MLNQSSCTKYHGPGWNRSGMLHLCDFIRFWSRSTVARSAFASTLQKISSFFSSRGASFQRPAFSSSPVLGLHLSARIAIPSNVERMATTTGPDRVSCQQACTAGYSILESVARRVYA